MFSCISLNQSVLFHLAVQLWQYIKSKDYLSNLSSIAVTQVTTGQTTKQQLLKQDMHRDSHEVKVREEGNSPVCMAWMYCKSVLMLLLYFYSYLLPRSVFMDLTALQYGDK